jgi:hypothetical protein
MADLDARQDVKQAFDDATESVVVDTIAGPAGPGNSSKDWEQCVQLGFVDGKWRIVVV